MDQESVDLLFGCISFLFPLGLLIVTYFVGHHIERRHLQDVLEREEKYRNFPTVTFKTPPAGWQVVSADVAQGGVVISIDYFKRFLATLRGIIGGRIKSYEPLLDRARREALLRMTEDAVSRGFDAVLNVRLETARLASARADGKGTAGVEMFAFGTAVKLAK